MPLISWEQYATFNGGLQYATYLWIHSMPHFTVDYSMPRTSGYSVCHILQWITVCHVPLDTQYATFYSGLQYATYLWMHSMQHSSVKGSMPRISGCTVCHIHLWVAVCHVSLDARYATLITRTTVLQCLYASIHPIFKDSLSWRIFAFSGCCRFWHKDTSIT